HLSSGHVAYLREEIAALKDLSKPDAQILVNLYADERDRCARVARSCLDAGVKEREIKLAEAYGATIAHVLRDLFNDRALSLSSTQKRALPVLLRRHLLAAEGRRSLTGAAATTGG